MIAQYFTAETNGGKTGRFERLLGFLIQFSKVQKIEVDYHRVERRCFKRDVESALNNRRVDDPEKPLIDLLQLEFQRLNLTAKDLRPIDSELD